MFISSEVQTPFSSTSLEINSVRKLGSARVAFSIHTTFQKLIHEISLVGHGNPSFMTSKRKG